MTAPTNRAQRILHFVAGCTTPATLAQIVAAAEPGGEYRRYSKVVSVQLSGLVNDGKLNRIGTLRAYTYLPTATTLVDGRVARRKVKPQPPRKPIKPKPAARKAAPVRERKPPRPVPEARRFLVARPTPRPAGQRETVEEFEARGGRIQKLKHGESSGPAYENLRAIDQRSMRKRLAQSADNDDTTAGAIADVA